MVAINRDGGTKTMRKMLDKVKSKLKTGQSIIIFPEGTRKIPGSEPDYKTGFIGIYKQFEVANLIPAIIFTGSLSHGMNQRKILLFYGW